jgi:hypothetical protein
MNKSCLCALVVLAAASPLLGEFVYAPASASTTGPVGTGLNSPLRSSARTIQQVLRGADLTVGGANALSGVAFRGGPAALNPAGTWPATDLSFASYDISIGLSSVALGTPLSATFADNVVPGTDTLLRSGPLTVAAGSFGPAVWGPQFLFGQMYPVTAALNYILTIRHTGSGATGAGADYFMDTIPGAGNYQDCIVATAGGYTATSGLAQGAYIVTRFQVPGPGAGALLALGGVLAASRRRR